MPLSVVACREWPDEQPVSALAGEVHAGRSRGARAHHCVLARPATLFVRSVFVKVTSARALVLLPVTSLATSSPRTSPDELRRSKRGWGAQRSNEGSFSHRPILRPLDALPLLFLPRSNRRSGRCRGLLLYGVRQGNGSAHSCNRVAKLTNEVREDNNIGFVGAGGGVERAATSHKIQCSSRGGVHRTGREV